MKRLAIGIGVQVGVAVGVTVVLAIVLGFVATHAGGLGVLRVLRDLAIMLLALFYLVSTLIWAAVYAGASVGMAWLEGKQARVLGWVEGKTLWVEDRVTAGMERFIARPLARTARTGTAATTFVRHLVVGPVARLDMRAERSGWRTRLNRLRHAAVLPARGREPRYRNERDMQPGPGIAV